VLREPRTYSQSRGGPRNRWFRRNDGHFLDDQRAQTAKPARIRWSPKGVRANRFNLPATTG